MTNAQQLTSQARRLTAARTTEQLIADFAVTDELMVGLNADDNAVMAMSRGWIMDELEARDADAFGRWVDSPDMSIADLRAAYGA